MKMKAGKTSNEAKAGFNDDTFEKKEAGFTRSLQQTGRIRRFNEETYRIHINIQEKGRIHLSLKKKGRTTGKS